VKEEKGTKIVNKIKTFQVPSDLGKIKENLAITTNTPSQSLKEKIINQAFKYHSEGNILEAKKYYQYFLKKGFTDPRVFFNFGILLQDLGKVKEAFDCYIKIIEIAPNYPNIYPLITRFLKDSNLSQLDKSNLKKILHLLLKKTDINHKELFGTFNFLCRNKIINNEARLDSISKKIDLFLSEEYIVDSLKKIIFRDIKLEKILTKIRKNMCERIAKNIENFSDFEVEFLIALAEQCFLNEYIYSLTKKETNYISLIIKRCQNGELNEKNILILSCYCPLYKLLNQIPSLQSFNSPNKNFEELIKSQILEPVKEIELSKTIKKLGSINDNISQQVKSQYEENPYPRWRYGSVIKDSKLSSEIRINLEIKPNSINQTIGNNYLKILIAGCGTGHQILQAQRYENAQITSIDLSLSSLSYAQRKINELKIDNVELIQMDILEVALLEEQYDIIECSGVLHHMDDPLKGLKALLTVLKANGFLKLGLYSELARQDVIRAKEYIARKKLKTIKNDIQIFREDVISGNFPEIENIKQRSSFYSTSECRDLCFHKKEHRFTIKQLRQTLHDNELKFLGFILQNSVKSLYKRYFPNDKRQINLTNWAKFEEKHSNTFNAMYQFWVSRKEM